MIAVTGILAAGGVGVALGFRDKIRKVWRDLVEWKDKGLGAGRPKDLLVVGGSGLAALGVTALSLSYFGFGGIATLGGGSAVGSAAAASYSAPNTPTVTAVMFEDTAGYANGSAFVGSLDDTLQYAIYEFDSLRGDFTTAPVLVDTQQANGGHPLRSDTVLNFTANDTFKVRVTYLGALSGYTDWDDVVTNEGGLLTARPHTHSAVQENPTIVADASGDCTNAIRTYLDSADATAGGGQMGIGIAFSGLTAQAVNDKEVHRQIWIEYWQKYSSNYTLRPGGSSCSGVSAGEKSLLPNSVDTAGSQSGPGRWLPAHLYI